MKDKLNNLLRRWAAARACSEDELRLLEKRITDEVVRRLQRTETDKSSE